MFSLMILASVPFVAARPVSEPDCRQQVVLASSTPQQRDTTPQRQQRPRTKPQPGKDARPCVILAGL
jgi:hypothetical protein